MWRDYRKLNKIFEVQTWKNIEDDGSEIELEFGFDTLPEAKAKYDTITVKGGGKLLMKYASIEDDADGDVLEEFWT